MKNSKKYYYKQLDNGLKIVYYYKPKRYTFYLEAFINNGSIHENKENWGISHFLEHAIMSGTKSFKNVKELTKFTNKIGGYTNAATFYNQIDVYGEFPYTEIKNAILLLYEHLIYPNISPKIIKAQKGVIEDEILTEKESKSYRLTEFAYKNTLDDPQAFIHYFPLGEVSTLYNISCEQLSQWHKKHYQPKNIIIGGTGAVPPSKFFKYIEDKFSKLENPDSEYDPLINYYDLSKVKLKEKNVVVQGDPIFEKASLIINFPYLNFLDNSKKEFAIASLIRDYLVDNSGSILFQELREKEGMIYNIFSNSLTGIIKGSWVINTSFDMKYFEKIIRIINKALRDILKGDINTSDIKSRQEYIAKTYMMKYDVHSNALNDYMAEYYFQYLTKGKRIIYTPKQIMKIYSEITIDEIKALVPKIINFDRVNVMLYGKFDQSKKMKIKNKLVNTFIKNV